jgi:ABC-type transport system involved in multi-copper enzyme maturation permease subunit
MNNPIVQRELVGMLRTRRALAMQVGLVAAMAVLVLVRWPAAAQISVGGAEAQQVLSVFAYGLLVAVMLLAPVFPATSIVTERLRSTLPLLLNSPLKPAEIVIGKLIGTVGYTLLLLLLSLPAAAACYSMGGINLVDQVGAMYGVLLALALMYGTLGLVVSTYAQSTDSSLRVTYGVILLLAVVAMGPARLLSAYNLPAYAETLIEWIRCVSPIAAMMEVLGDAPPGNQGAPWRFVLIALVSTGIFSLWTGARMNQRMLDRSRPSGTATEERSRGQQIYRRIMYLWFFDPQRRSGNIGPWTNPVMVKEQRTSRFGRSHWIMRLIGACLIVSLGLMLLTTAQTTAQPQDLGKLGGITVLLQVALIVLLTPSLASGMISVERETGGWEQLRMTPLTAGQIVRGKLLSVIQTLVLLLLATLPGYLVLLYVDPDQQWRIAYVLLTLVLIAGLALLVSAAISSLCKRTATATAIAYTLLILLCAGTLLIWLGEEAPFSPRLVETVLMVNPLATALNLSHTPGFAQYNLAPINWWITGGICVAALLVLMGQTYRLTRPQ